MTFAANRSAQAWVKAKRCTASTCVEVRMTPQLISVRDSKQNDPEGGENSQPILDVGPGAWLTFLSEVLERLPAGTNESLFFSRQSNGDMVLTNATQPDVSLRYDAEEWDAFSAGVADGDFGPIEPITALTFGLF